MILFRRLIETSMDYWAFVIVLSVLKFIFFTWTWYELLLYLFAVAHYMALKKAHKQLGLCYSAMISKVQDVSSL